MDAARAGDESAWRQIYEALAPGVRGYLRARRVADADDLVGDVFLEVARRMGTFKGDLSQFRAWVFVIAHSRYVDAVRAAERRPTSSIEEASEPVDAHDVEREVVNTLEREALLKVVDSLTPNQRAVVLLRVFGDLSVAETGEALGKSAAAVKVNHHRAVKALKRSLSRGSHMTMFPEVAADNGKGGVTQ